jgi:hypothetical protein
MVILILLILCTTIGLSLESLSFLQQPRSTATPTATPTASVRIYDLTVLPNPGLCQTINDVLGGSPLIINISDGRS